MARAGDLARTYLYGGMIAGAICSLIIIFKPTTPRSWRRSTLRRKVLFLVAVSSLF